MCKLVILRIILYIRIYTENTRVLSVHRLESFIYLISSCSIRHISRNKPNLNLCLKTMIEYASHVRRRVFVRFLEKTSATFAKNFYFCSIRARDRYRLLGTVINLLEIKLWPLKVCLRTFTGVFWCAFYWKTSAPFTI